jgi:hypothetical protein
VHRETGSEIHSTPWTMERRFTPRYENLHKDSHAMDDGAEIHFTQCNIPRDSHHVINSGAEIHLAQRNPTEK